MDCQHDHRHSLFCILPPHMLESIAEAGDAKARKWALNTLVGRYVAAHRADHDAGRPCRSRGALAVAAPAQAAADLQRQPRQLAARHPGSRRGARAGRRRRGRRGLRRIRRDVRSLLGHLQAQLDRQRRHEPDRHRPLPVGLRQRVLERLADGVRRRRRDVLQPVHHLDRRDGPRADARRHRASGEPRLPRPARCAERVDVRCDRARWSSSTRIRPSRPPPRRTG